MEGLTPQEIGRVLQAETKKRIENFLVINISTLFTAETDPTGHFLAAKQKHLTQKLEGLTPQEIGRVLQAETKKRIENWNKQKLSPEEQDKTKGQLIWEEQRKKRKPIPDFPKWDDMLTAEERVLPKRALLQKLQQELHDWRKEEGLLPMRCSKCNAVLPKDPTKHECFQTSWKQKARQNKVPGHREVVVRKTQGGPLHLQRQFVPDLDKMQQEFKEAMDRAKELKEHLKRVDVPLQEGDMIAEEITDVGNAHQGNERIPIGEQVRKRQRRVSPQRAPMQQQAQTEQGFPPHYFVPIDPRFLQQLQMQTQQPNQSGIGPVLPNFGGGLSQPAVQPQGLPGVASQQTQPQQHASQQTSPAQNSASQPGGNTLPGGANPGQFAYVSAPVLSQDQNSRHYPSQRVPNNPTNSQNFSQQNMRRPPPQRPNFRPPQNRGVQPPPPQNQQNEQNQNL